VLFSELRFCGKHTETGAKARNHIAISTFISYLAQHTMPTFHYKHLNLNTFGFEEHMTPHSFAFVRPVITNSHFLLVGGRD